jgi:hypothetical protein
MGGEILLEGFGRDPGSYIPASCVAGRPPGNGAYRGRGALTVRHEPNGILSPVLDRRRSIGAREQTGEDARDRVRPRAVIGADSKTDVDDGQGQRLDERFGILAGCALPKT